MNIIEHDHRAIKRATRPSLNSKSFRYAGSVLAGIELMYMIRKAQFMSGGVDAISFAEQFSVLAGLVVQYERCSDGPKKYHRLINRSKEPAADFSEETVAPP
jgi:hypothetical protein